MISNIITIGNSRGIRIPKILLEESGLDNEVELQVKKGEIVIKPLKKNKTDTHLLSEKTLETDWNRREEEEAWDSLQ